MKISKGNRAAHAIDPLAGARCTSAFKWDQVFAEIPWFRDGI